MKKDKVEETINLQKKLLELVRNFEIELKKDDLRQKVLSLIPVFRTLRNMGKSLIPKQDAPSARERILYYFLKYPCIVIKGDELLVVSAIQEYARRVRELRVQFGWPVVSGLAVKEMAEEGEFPLEGIDGTKVKPDEYILLSIKQDKEAAFRWNIANEIRKRKDSVRNKVLEYLKQNVGKAVTGEELRYVANNRSEWARRVRELRTEFGWHVATKNTGRPDLPVGSYILESLEQSPEHDRHIPDPVRGAVLRRDNYTCVQCGWNYRLWNPSDPRYLELHHIMEHVDGGENSEENLLTLCNICHDDVHRKK
jgi:hypothetical protein